MSARQALYEFFAVCAPGLEPLVDAELRALKMASVERQVGGVYFRGRIEDAWRANLELRCAVRVLWRLARFEALDADALYAGVAALDWRRFLGPETSFAIDAQVRESALDHSLFVAQRAKDAIVDQLRGRDGERPSVDRADPDVRLHLHLWRDRATLSLDTSGESLHKRGWRRFQGRAPLAETLAAAVVLLSGWDRRAPLVDPFCGSGTLLVEAALLALDCAPGLFRARFGFERLPGFERARWEALCAAARDRARPAGRLQLVGGDSSEAAVEGAADNLAAVGLEGLARLAVADARELAPRRGWNAWIVSNPPYGERVGDAAALAPLYAAFGARLRERCAGYRVALLSGNAELAAGLELPLERRAELRNGALECELLCGVLP